MSLRNDISIAREQAMKSGKKEDLSTLRMVISAIKNLEIEKRRELSDEDVQNVIITQVKQLRDSLSDFERGGRDDLVKRAQAELTLLSAYLPAQLGEGDLISRVKELLNSLGNKEKINMGQAMGAVMKELKGKADGKRIKEAVEQILNSKS
ncbi:MAG: GatB/YqeY domain-containing protein [Patescibacteria group bacterium]